MTQDGVGVATFNVRNDGAAVGQANSSVMSILDILLAVDKLSKNDNGVLYSGDALLRNEANTLFSAINTAGSI